MIGMALNNSHDIYLFNGAWVRNKAIENTAQNVKTRLLLFRGELIYNIRAGVPYYQDILGATPSLKQIEAIILSEIRKTDGVNVVINFNSVLDKSTRKMSINFTANSIYGDFTVADLNITTII